MSVVSLAGLICYLYLQSKVFTSTVEETWCDVWFTCSDAQRGINHRGSLTCQPQWFIWLQLFTATLSLSEAYAHSCSVFGPDMLHSDVYRCAALKAWSQLFRARSHFLFSADLLLISKSRWQSIQGDAKQLKYSLSSAGIFKRKWSLNCEKMSWNRSFCSSQLW